MQTLSSGTRTSRRGIAAGLLAVATATSALTAVAPATASVVHIEWSGRLVRDTTRGSSPELEAYLASQFDGLGVRASFDIDLATADIDAGASRADYRGAMVASRLQIGGAALVQSTQQAGFDCSGGSCVPVHVPYCGGLDTLDCTVQVANDLASGGVLRQDSVAMRSHSFAAPGTVPLAQHVFPMTSFNFLHQLFTIDGSNPGLLTDTSLLAALADFVDQGQHFRVNLQGVPLDGVCGNDCYAASWRIDDLAFGPAAVGNVPEPATAGLALLALGLLAASPGAAGGGRRVTTITVSLPT